MRSETGGRLGVELCVARLEQIALCRTKEIAAGRKGRKARVIHVRREQIFARDEFRCAYCGERFEAELLTVDHVQPKMRGGDRSGGNLVTACGGCNARKGGMRLSEFLRVDPAARDHFFARAARHVWPRILRALEEDLKKGTPDGGD